jgi:hypothetical protein
VGRGVVVVMKHVVVVMKHVVTSKLYVVHKIMHALVVFGSFLLPLYLNNYLFETCRG